MIDAYINKVLTYLPSKQRNDLADELRSLIEDACGDDRSPDNIKRVLADLGSPRDLAFEYSEQKELIGPRYFARYKQLLYLVAAISLPLIFVLTFKTEYSHHFHTTASVDASYTIYTSILIALFASLKALISGALILFAFVTVIFIIMEKTQSDIDLFAFDIDSLDTKPKIKSERSFMIEGILSIIGVIIATFFLLNIDSIPVEVVHGNVLTLTDLYINPVVFNQLLPFGLLVLGISFIGAIIRLILKKDSVTVHLLSIISAGSWIAFFTYALQMKKLLLIDSWAQLNHWTFLRDVFSPLTLSPQIGILSLLILISLIELVINIYKLLKFVMSK